MRTLKVIVTIEMESDARDEEMLREDIYSRLQDEMTEETLDFKVIDLEDEEQEEDF
jgi:hypothetical protein